MEINDRVYVAGHNGMVGSAVFRLLQSKGYQNLIGKRSAELDLRNQEQTARFFEEERPDYVILAAAKVGGIHANNTYRADFIYDNLAIQNNVIHYAHEYGVKKLLFLGSSCIYPKFANQPISEDELLNGKLETTNEPYAIAKIAGLKLCESYRLQYGDNFITAMPTNLYGYGDNYDLNNSHVFPALIRKFSDAVMFGEKTVTLWGTGSPRREFLHVDDLAEAVYFLMQHYDGTEIVNIGTGEDIPIKELAELIASKVGFKGTIEFDISKPDGTPRKLLDVSRLTNLGWKSSISLDEGILLTLHDYMKKRSTYSLTEIQN